MDKIMIRGLRVFAYHGVNPEEKEKGQPFELDITLEADLRRPRGRATRCRIPSTTPRYPNWCCARCSPKRIT